MAKQDDGLFLLEVLIDKIVFVKSPCFSDKDFRTCVNIECPAVEPLEICDDDPGACVAKSGGPFVKTFNNGKSCLFSLKEGDIAKAMSKFPIKISVYKSLPCGCLPTKIILGESTIDMTKEFVQARKKFLEDPNNVSYQALKDSFRIVGPDGTETGDIVMFLRISCFGKLIVTRFQGAGGPPRMGTGVSGGSTIVDRSCNPKRDFQTSQDPCVCGAARAQSESGSTRGINQPCIHSGGGVCPPARDPYNSMPCEDPDDPCYCTGPKPPAKQQLVCRNTDQYCLHVPKDCCPTGNKVIFQIPSDSCGTGHKQRAHFNFTSDGIGDVSRDEPGQLMPTTADNYPGVVYDFPKQVIKLRVGKTIEMPGTQPSLPIKKKLSQEINFDNKFGSKLYRLPVFEEEFYQKTKKKRNAPILANNAYLQPVTDDTNSLNTGYEKKNSSSDEVSTLLYSMLQYDRQNQFTLNAIDDHFLNTEKPCLCMTNKYTNEHLFGNKKTFVYVTLDDNISRRRSSGTQATASLNKCLQVSCNSSVQYGTSILGSTTDYCSTSTLRTNLCRDGRKCLSNNVKFSEVYFFGRKKESLKDNTGVGSSSSKTKPQRTDKVFAAPFKSGKTNMKGSTSIQAQYQCCSIGAQTNKQAKGSSTGTSTGKAVSIKESNTETPCPAYIGTKGDMVATVSHIKIGPREPCPVHGKEPCQGPKCVLASSGEEKAPVKVTTVTNARRGVFELVIRRMAGAPLAKNELMLEWTPPPSRPLSCGVPCPVPCSPSGSSRLSKCKLIVCRASPCKPKICKRSCKIPCGPVPYKVPCKTCCKPSCVKPPCCSKPCRYCKRCPSPLMCKPCPPVSCKPCSPSCSRPPCGVPCSSSPCLRPCPVGRKISRKVRSQPRMRSHRKRISPCYNRAKTCPVVRCRSMPGPCMACCALVACPPRKCCSASPSKPIRCCKSDC